MMNCSIFALAHVLTQLMAAEYDYRQMAVFADAAQTNPALRAKAEAIGAAAASIYASDRDKEKAQGLLRLALHLSDQMGLEATRHRADMFDIRLKQTITLNDFAAEFRVLREAIEGEIKFEYFFHYQKAKALLLLHAPGDWGATLGSFRSAKKDIDEAVDCYACGHETACVFHCMRILEHGLRELASAVNLTFDVQVWNDIINQIESAIRDLGNSWGRSTLKSEWMGFYSEAAKEFFHFKDGWRNHVSHNHATYDEPSARNVLEHVRTFMNHLSSRLSE